MKPRPFIERIKPKVKPYKPVVRWEYLRSKVFYGKIDITNFIEHTILFVRSSKKNTLPKNSIFVGIIGGGAFCFKLDEAPYEQSTVDSNFKIRDSSWSNRLTDWINVQLNVKKYKYIGKYSEHVHVVDEGVITPVLKKKRTYKKILKDSE